MKTNEQKYLSTVSYVTESGIIGAATYYHNIRYKTIRDYEVLKNDIIGDNINNTGDIIITNILTFLNK